MARSTQSLLDQLDDAIYNLQQAMIDTSGVEEYQLPSGVRVRRSAFGSALRSLYSTRADLMRSVSMSSLRRVRVGSLSLAGGIDR